MGSLMLFTAAAQTKPGVKTKTITKYKPPKLFTNIGKARDSALLPVGDVIAILPRALTVTDANKNVYTVTYYQFLYKKNVMAETEDGKPYPSTSITSQKFYNGNPLPAIYQSTITESLKKNEYLYFFDIIVKDAKGRSMYAPDVKITTL